MGTIQKRVHTPGKPVRWVARARTNGRERSKSFPTKGEAKAWMREQESLKPSAARMDTLTVHEAMKLRTADPDASEGTLAIRKHVLNNLGELGRMKVGRVSSTDVDAWRLELLSGREWLDGKPLAAVTVANMHVQLSALFKWAVDEGQIARNPARKKTRKQQQAGMGGKVTERDVIPESTVKELLGVAGWFRPVILLGAMCGLRAGEVGGLRTYSVHDHHVQVREQAGLRNHPVLFRPLKNAASARDIPLTHDLEQDLLSLVSDVDGPLFRSPSGGVLTAMSISRQWNKLAKKVDVGEHTFHSLRHLFATKLIREGLSVVAVQRLMGHSTPSVTLNVYSHWWPDDGDRARQALDGWLW